MVSNKPPIIRVPHRTTHPLPRAGESIGSYQVLDDAVPENGFYLFEVRHPQLDVMRQLKAVPKERVSPEFLRKLADRLRVVGALSSPCLHRPLESGFDEAHQLYYSVYEKLAPKSLCELENYGALTGEEALSVLLAASGGLAALEEAGLHHGRLSPEKIVFSEEFRQIKLDGLDLSPDEENITPVPAEGREEGESDDLFALGSIAYRMVTGRYPAAGEDERNDPRRWQPDFPGPLAVVIMRLLSSDPMTGFQCAAELESELKRLLSRFVPVEVRKLCLAPKRELPAERNGKISGPGELRGGGAASGRFRFYSGLVIAVLVILLLFTVAVRLMTHVASAPAAEPVVFRLSPENQRLKTEQEKLERELDRLNHLRNAWSRNQMEGGK